MTRTIPESLRWLWLLTALAAGCSATGYDVAGLASEINATRDTARAQFVAGDTVQVLARGNGFVVGGEGQAMGPGIEGREVRVRTESGRVLTGVPVGDRRVEVLL